FHMNTAVDSARGITATPVGTAFVSGLFGDATQFGDAAGLDLGLAPDLLAGAGAFTISAWVKLSALLNAQGFAILNVAVNLDGSVNGVSRAALELTETGQPKLIVRAPDTEPG